jgi:hypothetical protein
MTLRRAHLAALLALSSVGAAAQMPGQPAAPVEPLSAVNYRYVTAEQRWKWYLRSTLGPESLLVAGPVNAGWTTLFNEPQEYGPHWEGAARRYRIRMVGVMTGYAIEAAAGAALGEDPRYVRSAPGTPFGGRVKRIIRLTFMAHGRDGNERFSYSRVAGNVGSNFLSNSWRVGSDSTVREASVRCVWGVASRMAGNAFAEFMPDLLRKVRRK